ncbi:hypothetical protein BC830DRAFT_540945 [Chytriomyces sp. MP71]|nr:hypothetical protein BC830DRAFT_540945 [Chytriomyces sp. MP71]
MPHTSVFASVRCCTKRAQQTGRALHKPYLCIKHCSNNDSHNEEIDLCPNFMHVSMIAVQLLTMAFIHKTIGNTDCIEVRIVASNADSTSVYFYCTETCISGNFMVFLARKCWYLVQLALFSKGWFCKAKEALAPVPPAKKNGCAPSERRSLHRVGCNGHDDDAQSV